MTFKELVIQLGEFLGVDTSQFEDEQGITFVYKNNLRVSLEPIAGRDGKYHLYAELGKLPEISEIRKDYNAVLIASHLFGYATHNSYFGIHKPTQSAYLFKLINLSKMQAEDFYDVFGRFLEAQQFWFEQLKHPRRFLEAEKITEEAGVSVEDDNFERYFDQLI